MDDVLPILTAYAAYITPAAIALTWSRFSKLPAVQKLMMLTAKTILVVVTSMFLFTFLVDWLCDGDAAKGHYNCAVFPGSVANLSLPIVLLSTVALAALAFVVVVISIVREFASRSKRNEPEV